MASHDHGSHVLEEPKTPMWLPALGAFLFLLAGIWFATRPAEPTATPDIAPGAAPTATAQPALVPGGGGARPAEQPGHEGHGH